MKRPSNIFPKLVLGGMWLLIIGALAGGAMYLYSSWRHGEKVKAIMSGEVRGNKQSKIFHVPTCPNYASIAEKNIRVFDTATGARDAGYQPSSNCTDEIAIRTETEFAQQQN